MAAGVLVKNAWYVAGLADEFAPLALQGQYLDAETGLVYNRHRYFIPELNSFASADPAGLMAGSNAYRFGPNTHRWIDPLGLACSAGSTACRPERRTALPECVPPRDAHFDGAL